MKITIHKENPSNFPIFKIIVDLSQNGNLDPQKDVLDLIRHKNRCPQCKGKLKFYSPKSFYYCSRCKQAWDFEAINLPHAEEEEECYISDRDEGIGSEDTSVTDAEDEGEEY